MTTFKQISYKIFKANLRRYLVYFLCSSYAITVFFVFSTIYTNKSLVDPSKIDSSVSSMLIAPTLGVIIFSAFFIMYAHNAFAKFRKKEFGLFMVLGMTNIDIIKITLFENSMIAVFSLITGLISGTLISRLFYFIVSKIIDVKGIPFILTLESYFYTTVFFILVYILVILSSIIVSSRYEIVNLLKAFRREDKSQIDKPFLCILGIAIIGISIFDIIKNFKTGDSIVFYRSILVCFIGIYLIISNVIWYIKRILNYSIKNYFRNMLFIANLKYTFGQSEKILFLITLLVSITIFFSSISVLFISDSQRLAIAYNPYHIAYAEIYGKNKVSDELINNIIKTSETPLMSCKTLEFIKKTAIILLSDEKLNTILGKSIHVDRGHFISLFQVVKDDGYTYDTTEIKNLNISSGSVKNTYVSQGKLTEVLFNNIPILNGHYVILNNNDYLDIKSKQNNAEIGYIKLMNFENWYKTKEVEYKLKSELERYNKLNTKIFYENIDVDINMFKAVSRVEDYMQRRQAGSLSLFLFSFIGMLFFVSSSAILHLKLVTEYEREKIKYTKLYKMGITDKEVSKIISKELKVLFFLPFLLGIFVATFYSYSLPVQVGKQLVTIKYSLIIGTFYIIFQMLYYSAYKKMYIKKFLSNLGY